MWAERERQNFRSPLKPISVTPDPRSVSRSATSRSAPANFLHPLTAPIPLTWFLARSAPAPLLLQHASSSKLKKWTDFYRTSSYDSCRNSVCLSVRLSVCHTRVLRQNQTMHWGYFNTTRKGNHPGFPTPTVVGGRRPLRLKRALKLTQPFKTRRFRQISAYNISTLRDGENSSIMTNGQSTSGFPTSYKWSSYITPK